MSILHIKLPDVIKDNFWSGTLTFLFILVYINVFQLVLGADNTIVGVIFVILMTASMIRDLTATPIKHLFFQGAVLIWMAVAAYLVNVLPPPLSLLINFITLFLILYAYTYEYSNHIYFPYILSYLFLLFIAPVTAERMPVRIVAMAVGAVSIVLYQWVMGRRRVIETAKDVLTKMIDHVCGAISYRAEQSVQKPDLADVRRDLAQLCRTVYDRRKKTLCISDAAYSMIAVGRGLEHLLLLLEELPQELSGQEVEFLLHTVEELKVFRAFLGQEITTLAPLDLGTPPPAEGERSYELFLKTMVYIRDRLLHMTDPEKKLNYRKTTMSFQVRVLSAIDFSPLRAVYALRVALLLSLATLLVQIFGLAHGKWLLFTIGSVSLPYADDVPMKMKKRFLATMLGCLVSLVLYTLVPSATGRTVIMLLSGYLSFYFRDYVQTFACSTVGALGGAVFLDIFGFQAVGSAILIRVGYIVLGVVIAYIFNCKILPYSRATATKQLWKKYQSMTDTLAYICRSDRLDPQLYYSLVIQVYLLEEKLVQNAKLEGWETISEDLKTYREKVDRAHRRFIAGRADAPVLETVT